MKKVLWVSRHQMTEEQRSNLERGLGDSLELIPWRNTVESIEELLPAIEGTDALAVVLPTDLLAKLMEYVGERPVLYAVSERRRTGRMHTLPDGRQEAEFAFVHREWRQVVRMEFVSRPL